MNTSMSPNDIVPEAYQMRLMMWRDEFTRGYFEIGDIANEIVSFNIQKEMQIDQNSIYSAIGKFCGKSGRTVRDYAEVSAFFPPDMRSTYDVLPFSHFRFAKSCGLRYQDILDFSMENPSASVDALESKFNCHTSWVNTNVDDKGVMVMNAPITPETVLEGFYGKKTLPPQISEVYALANLISQSERLLTWDLNKYVRQELITSLEGLKHVLSTLSNHANDVDKYEYEKLDSANN